MSRWTWDVVGAFPVFKDNVVAQQPGQYGEAFDGSVAAQDFDALVDDFVGQHGGAVFVEVDGHAQEAVAFVEGLTPAGLHLIQCLHNAQRARQHGRGIAAHFGQHVLHQREVDDGLLEGAAVLGVAPGYQVGAAGIGAAADGVVNARGVDDVGHGVAEAGVGFTHLVGQGVAQFQFAAGHGTGAQLVF